MTTLVVGWLFWCGLHSLLISRPVIDSARHLLGPRFAWYRPGYVVFSTVSLLPLILHQYGLPQEMLWSWRGYWRLVQAVLVLHTLVMALGGARVHSASQLLGLEQLRRARLGLTESPPALHTGGILRHVRHPWYSGGLSFLWAFGPFTDVSLVVRCLLSVYLLLGAGLEERKLIAAFGVAYRDYRVRTPAFIPWRLFLPARPGVTP